MSLIRQFKLQDGNLHTQTAAVNASGEVSTINTAITDKSQFSKITDGADTMAVNADGSINTTPTGAVSIQAGDSPSIDAFGRWRVSNPETLFDSKNIFDDPDLASSVENQPLFYDNQEISGSGTSTAYNTNQASQSLSVGATTAGVRTRQTKRCFNYQPGKSQLILMTFTFDTPASGITQREGIFDDNNGIFFEADGTGLNIVRRTYVTGSAVDNEVAQASWNIDTLDGNGASGLTLDPTKTNIFFIDFAWLGVSRVRCGFVIDGLIYYCHEFLNANNLAEVYMSTPNLPLRSEITNDGTGVASTMTQICSTVISEGGSQDVGPLRYADTNGTHVDCNTENTVYAVLGMRLKSDYIGATVKINKIWQQIQTASHQGIWTLRFNPTVAGTFTYSGLSQSAIEYATGATANTVTGGYLVDGGFVFSAGGGGGKAGGADGAIESALLLGALIDGTVDELVLCFMPVGGSSNVDVEGGITWRELL